MEKTNKIRIINNRYHVEKKLAEGGMGAVYLVRDFFKEQQLCALKMIRRDTMVLTNILQFKHEFEIMTRLWHPNLAQVYEFGKDNEINRYYITMEYLSGEVLSNILSQRKQINLEKCIDIMIMLCRALDFIHSKDIYHRDIKPGNIMISEDGNAKILDFGLSDLGVVKKNRTKGTWLYLAPEVLQGKIDQRVDIFAAGVTFFKLLTGDNIVSLKKSDSILRLLQNNFNYQENLQSSLQEIKHDGLRKVISKMVAFQPENRFKRCSDVINAIGKALGRKIPLETKDTIEAYVIGKHFSGRQIELARILNMIRERENDIENILISGTLGIGKSSIIKVLKEYSQVDEVPYFEISDMQQKVEAFHSIRKLINEMLYSVEKETLNKFASYLKKLLPSNEKLKNYKVFAYDASRNQHKFLTKQIAEFFLEYMKQRLVSQDSLYLMFIDDLQWIDESSFEVIYNILRSIKSRSEYSFHFYLISTYSIEEKQSIQAMISKLEALHNVHKIKLTPFNDEEVERYIEAIFGVNRIDLKFRSTTPLIRKHVGGNPYFLQELLKSMLIKHIIIRKRNFWTVSRLFNTDDIPPNLFELVQERINRLELTQKQIKTLTIMSFLSRNYTFNELSILCDYKILDEIKQFLRELERIEVITSNRKNAELEYGFVHSLIKEVISSKVEDKKTFHLHIATTLEKIYQDKLDEYSDELAFHFQNTDEKDKTIYYFEKASERAKQLYDNLQALYYCDKIIELLPENAYEKITDKFQKKGVLLAQLGRIDESKTMMEKAFHYAGLTKDQRLIAKSKNSLGWIYQEKGDYSSALLIFQGALTLFEELGDKEGISGTLSNIGLVYWNQGQFEKALQFYNERLKTVEEMQDLKGLIIVLNNIGLVHWNQKNFHDAIDAFERQLKIADELNDKRSMGYAYGNLGLVYWKLGKFDEAMNCFNEKLISAETMGDQLNKGIAVGNIGLIEEDRGNFDNAFECYHAYLESSEKTGDERGICIACGNIGALCIKTLLFNKSEKYLKKAIKIGETLSLKYYTTLYSFHYGELLERMVRFHEAKEILSKVMQQSEEIHDEDLLLLSSALFAKVSFMEKGEKDDNKIYENSLKKLLKTTSQPEMEAMILETLFFISKKKKYGEASIRLYEDVYKKTSIIDYKIKFEMLKNC